MLDPKEPLTIPEKHVYGADAKRHPIAGFVIEQGSGAMPVDVQLRNYLVMVEHVEGKEAAEQLRVRCASDGLRGLVTIQPRQA